MRVWIGLIGTFFLVLGSAVSGGTADPVASEYAEEEAPYVPEPAAIEELRQIDSAITIVVFHGGWCQDCQREMPRFRKILDLAANPHFRVIEYEVNPQKQDVLGKFKEYGIQKVPTFIFFAGERELGRIVEKPSTSLEEDFLAIVGKSH